MRALVSTQLGSPVEPLRATSQPGKGPLELHSNYTLPDLRPGFVRIKVVAASLNFADALQLQGLYQDRPKLPFVPGGEISGVLVALGDGVKHLAIGAPVIALCGTGAFAEECVVDARAVIPLPAQISRNKLQLAAGLPVAFGTAHLALEHRARLQKGQTVLVLGAGGGVGLAAVQIAKLMGARVIAVARGAAKEAALRQLGADVVIAYGDAASSDPNAPTPPRLRELVKRAAPKGVDVVFDNVGGEHFDEALKAVKWGAHILVIGFASGRIPQIAANVALVKNLTVHGVFWGSYMKHDAKVLLGSLKLLSRWFVEEKLIVHVSHSYPLEGAPQAFQAILSRESVGKVLLNLEGPQPKL